MKNSNSKKKKANKPLPMVETVDTVKLTSKRSIVVTPAKRPKISKKEVFVPKSKDIRPKRAKMQAIRAKFVQKKPKRRAK